jgi:hypothetical protein
MDEEKPLRAMRAGKAPGCSSWTPFIPLPGVDGRQTAIAHDAAAAEDAVLLADPEGIENRLSSAICCPTPPIRF